MGSGPKLPKGKNLASQRSDDFQDDNLGVFKIKKEENIFPEILGSRHARPGLELGAGGGRSKMGRPMHLWT